MPKFSAGTSGNPKGRPRIDPDVRAALRALTPTAIDRLGQLMNDADPAVALKACIAVIDRTMPQGAPIAPDLPQTDQERTSVIEVAFIGRAVDGDTRASLDYLRARDPARWPRQANAVTADDRYVDVVDWTPAIIPADR